MVSIDCFAVLGEERRPWLDEAVLKSRFLEKSTPWHPDRHHGAGELERQEAERRYSELNGAHATLADPRLRLPHLMELESGERPRDIQRIPPGTMDLFVEVGQACRDADGFLARRQAVSAPMLRVRMFQEGLEWAERLKALQEKVRGKGATLEVRLRELNEVWLTAPPVGDPERKGRLPMEQLDEVYRVLSYVGRWTAQIQERMVQLAMA